VFNATFSNISVISWRPVLVVEEAKYPERTTDHGQATGKLYHLPLRVECTLLGRHDITEILLKVALNTINQIKS
jgi:hypothetical protein